MDQDFDDDDSFGALPDDTLQQLEHAAISSTQKPETVTTAPRQSQIRTYGTTGLTRNNHASNKGQWRPPQPRQQPPKAQPQAETAPPASAPAPPSSDYGFDEEDVIDLDEPSMVIQSTTSATALPSRARSEAPTRAPAGARHNAKKALDPETEAAFAAADAELATHQPFQHQQWTAAPHLQPSTTTTSSADIAALQSRIDALLSEQSRLQQSEASARNAAQAKAGEIAIVRANHAKAEKEYERRISVMQKMHADESAKAKAEAESGRREREKLETDRRFLAHDVEEARRERLSNGVATPKKNKPVSKGGRVSSLGDGFDGDEAMVVSPSRSKDREREREKNGSREQTPRVGNKRKRGAVQDSPVPVPALSFSAPRVERQESEKTVIGDSEQSRAHSAAREEEAKYDFMQKLLHHIPYTGHERSVESLTKHHFPSNTSRSLSSILLDGLYSTAPPITADPLPLRIARTLLNMWRQCLSETYYTPLYLLLDLLNFSISLERASTITKLIPQAVPLCIKTIELVANSTVRAALYPSFASSDEFKRVREDVGKHIDVDEVLDFLQRLCDAAEWDAGEIGGNLEIFWGCVDVNFVLLMLNKAQHISQIMTVLKMLRTSALENTFGPICQQADGDTAMVEGGAAETIEKQAKQGNILIERLVSLLLELPQAPSEEPAYSEEEIQELRLEILAVLRAAAFTEHGRNLLGRHRTAIGRLVRFLDGQMAKLYSARPSLGLSDSKSLPAENDTSINDSTDHGPVRPHDLIAQTINTTVRLLYHLLLSPSSQDPSKPVSSTQHPALNINLQQKLQSTRGGWHKFLVSFTRLAFSDQLVLEAGIEDAVVEAAHRVLDEVLSPEEGEAVCAAVETPRGTIRVANEVEEDGEMETAEVDHG